MHITINYDSLDFSVRFPQSTHKVLTAMSAVYAYDKSNKENDKHRV